MNSNLENNDSDDGANIEMIPSESHHTNDKKRAASKPVGNQQENIDEGMKRRRINNDEPKVSPFQRGNPVPFPPALSTSTDVPVRRASPTKGNISQNATTDNGIGDLAIPDGGEGNCSALSSACSSPAHPSSFNDASPEKESGHESAASVSSAASSASSASSSSFQCPPAPPTTPIAVHKPHFHSQGGEASRFQDVATPKPCDPKPSSSSGFPDIPTDEDMRRQSTPNSQTSKQSQPEQAETNKPSNATRRSSSEITDDFDTWKVGPKYELMRILGRGSYGEVAQAKDLHATESPKFVAIKRIATAFEQEVDALRFFREIHLLRRLRGHECIIQLIDVIAPENEKSFDDLYLVFECKFA